MHERRRSQRHSPNQDIFARIKSSIPVRIIDVSWHGMKVESTSALPPSGECDIWLPSDGGDVKTRIHVHRCRARFVQTEDFNGLMYQAGVEFLDMDANSREALESIINRLETGDSGGDELRTTIERAPGAEVERDATAKGDQDDTKMWRAV